MNFLELLRNFERDFNTPPYGENIVERALEIEAAAAALEDKWQQAEATNIAERMMSLHCYNHQIVNAFRVVEAMQRPAAAGRE